MLTICLIIALALIFDFMNGFHDAANSIATVVSTRVLTPRQAVAWAASFNFISFFIFGTHVATTLGKGIVDPQFISQAVIGSALFAAISWNIITWYFGIPSSSSHALIGGLVGAGWFEGGLNAICADELLFVMFWILIAPLLGFLLGSFLMFTASWMLMHRTPLQVDSLSRRLQLMSSALYSLGHGANDAQKTMGIIAILLFSAGYLGNDFYVPLWVVLCSQAAMGLGTLFGGWRIVRTLGMKIAKLNPLGGFSAESSGALVLFLATVSGIPVSTTHTITGAIVGVGAMHRLSSVRWGVAGRIVWAWILTIPASAGIAMLCRLALNGL